MRGEEGEGGEGEGEATAPQVVPETKGFPWLKNTAAVFVFGTHFTSLMEICS